MSEAPDLDQMPQAAAFSMLYFMSVIIGLMIVVPKFLVFFGMVRRLCVVCKKTDYFWAFVTATNWFYIVYVLLVMFHAFVVRYFDTPLPHWEKIMAGYFALVLYFLAQNILRLHQAQASLVSMAFVFTHLLILLVTGKHGLMIVF